MLNLRYLHLIFVLPYALCASGSESNEKSDYELDYYETECVCVPIYQCLEGNAVDDGTGIIHPRKKILHDESDEDKSTLCESSFDVCCRASTHAPITPTLQPNVHRCGVRNPAGISGRGRILTSDVDGETEFGEWPWQALVLIRNGSKSVFNCAGTLIDDRHILTVAHRVQKFRNHKNNIKVRVGEWNVADTDEFLSHEDYLVSEIFIHPNYRRNNLHNDVAIIKLSEDVNFRPHIDRVCLPNENDDFSGQECIVTGWGKNAYKDGSYSLIMKEVLVPVLSHEECQRMLRKTRLGRYFKLYKGFLCAGGKKGEDACKGDGGGPLVCYRPSDNSYTVAGLVSWGVQCGLPGVPGVYVNVKKYIEWIVSKTGRALEEYWNS